MLEVSISKARTNFSKLINLLETKTEDVIIVTKYGTKLFRITLINQPSKRIGIAKGLYNSVDLEEFDSVNEEIWKDYI